MSNSTMLTQTHMQQFNELTSSKQRSSELVKEPALIFVCYFTSHTGVLTGSWITFHWPPTCFWCSSLPDGCCTFGPPGSVGGKPAAPLLDAVELLLFERLPICVGCNGKARDVGLAQPSAAPPGFSCFQQSRRCQSLPQPPFINHRHSIVFTSLQKVMRLLEVF